MIYEYRCKTCGTTMHRTSRESPSCSMCQRTDTVRRVWGFQMQSVMHEHRDTATGSIVSDRRHITDELSRQSDLQSERTGIDHNYVQVDMSDRDSLKVSADHGRD